MKKHRAVATSAEAITASITVVESFMARAVTESRLSGGFAGCMEKVGC